MTGVGLKKSCLKRNRDTHWVRNRMLLKLTVWKESEVAAAGLW